MIALPWDKDDFSLPPCLPHPSFPLLSLAWKSRHVRAPDELVLLLCFLFTVSKSYHYHDRGYVWPCKGHAGVRVVGKREGGRYATVAAACLVTGSPVRSLVSWEPRNMQVKWQNETLNPRPAKRRLKRKENRSQQCNMWWTFASLVVLKEWSEGSHEKKGI